MAQIIPSPSSDNNCASPSQESRGAKFGNVKAGKGSEASRVAIADEERQEGRPRKPWKTLDEDTYFADYDDSDNGEYERLQMKKKAKKAEDAQKKQESDQKKGHQSWCAKCNISFETIERRLEHIKNSRRHFCCQHCESVLDFQDYPSLCSHYKAYHSLFYCDRCKHLSATFEESKTHIKTSARHYCCQCCDNVVEFKSASSLRFHYRISQPLQYCHNCVRTFATADILLAHMQEKHKFCIICRRYFSSHGLLEKHRRTCGTAKPPPQQEAIPRSHYATLGISPRSSQEEITKAAKEMRVKTHPDRLKRQGGLTEE